MMRMNDFGGMRPQREEWKRFGEGGRGRHRECYYRQHRGGARGGDFGGSEGGHRFFKRGEFKFALLELLDTEPMHGYQLIKAMEEKTGGMYTPSAGSIYPNLQLLEDMKLVGVSEEDGKKLYHITDEGRNHLRERAQTADDRYAERWERRGMRRPSGDFDKRDLREMVMQWPEVIPWMAKAARFCQQQPESEQAAQLREIMEKLQENIKQVIEPGAAASPEEPTVQDSSKNI